MIAFSCSGCGKTLKVKDEAAGKRVRCPGCKAIVAVPASSAAAPPAEGFKLAAPEPAPTVGRGGELGLAAEPDEAAKGSAPEAASLCPQCHVAFPPGAILCTTCGFDLRTGRKVVGRKSLLERIPWSSVRSAAAGLGVLAILIALLFFVAWRLSRPRQAGDSASKDEQGAAASPQTSKLPRCPGSLTAVRVRVVAKGPEPALPDGFVFRCEDGDYPAKKEVELLGGKIEREAADALFLAGHKVLRKAGSKAGPTEEELTLAVELELGWVYGRADGRFEPKAPYVASCTARLLRKSGVPFWESGKPYTVDPPAPSPEDKDDLAGLAALKSVRVPLDFDRYSDRLAAAVAKTALEDIPRSLVLAEQLTKEREAEETARRTLADFDSGKADAAQVAKLVTAGNSYVAAGLGKRLDKIEDPVLLAALAESAQDHALARRAAERYVKYMGSGPKAAEAARALSKPEELLLGPLRPRFTRASGSFAAERPLVEAAAPRWPFLALTFARTAAALETDAQVKASYRQFCDDLEKRGAKCGLDEMQRLGELGGAEAATLLGRTALLTLLRTGGYYSESAAAMYLFRVAAKRVPDVAEPWPDGSLRLSEDQMAMLAGIARVKQDVGTVVGVALLMRVGGPQRAEVRKFVKLPPPEHMVVAGALPDLQSDDPDKVRNTILHTLPPNFNSYCVSDLLADAYFKYQQPGVRSAALYGLFVCGAQREPYLWTLLGMLESAEVMERRTAAEVLQRIGDKTFPILKDLRAVLAKQTDPQTRRFLRSAIGQGEAALRRIAAQGGAQDRP